MTTCVLVRGAVGRTAELTPVIPELEAVGHRAIVVDPQCTGTRATVDDYACTVVEAMTGLRSRSCFRRPFGGRRGDPRSCPT